MGLESKSRWSSTSGELLAIRRYDADTMVTMKIHQYCGDKGDIALDPSVVKRKSIFLFVMVARY